MKVVPRRLLGAHPDRAPVGGGDLHGDVEPEPEPPAPLAALVVAAPEGLEEVGHELGGDGVARRW